MNEQELRALVRSTVARHLGSGVPCPVDDAGRGFLTAEAIAVPLLSSHTLYAGLVNIGDACVIEPAVKCDHCGYCKSHGY